jgi:hypothetical protein
VKDTADLVWGAKADVVGGLRALVEALPHCRKGNFGRWEDAVVVYAPWIDFLTDRLYATGWIRADFDWSQWARSEQAQTFLEKDFSNASSGDLAKLLTAFIRQDRFCEGALLNGFETGVISALLERTTFLLSQTHAELDAVTVRGEEQS